MDLLDSLVSLVNDQKKQFLMLIKFGSEENLKHLRCGKVYMKNLKFYNDLEEKGGSGKPDRYDGKWRMNNARIQITDPQTNRLIATGMAPSITMSYGYEKCPIFCLFGYDYRNCDSFSVDKEHNSCRIQTSFSNEQKCKLKKGLGEYALVVLDTNSFFKRIDAAFKAEGIEYLLKSVRYNTGNSKERVESIIQDSRNIAFNKDVDNFEYQQEIRFFITNRPVEDHLIVSARSLEDITQIISTDDLLRSRIELIQEFTNLSAH